MENGEWSSWLVYEVGPIFLHNGQGNLWYFFANFYGKQVSVILLITGSALEMPPL